MEPVAEEAKADARAVGLRYINDTQTPGIRRTGKAGEFRYNDPSGKPVTDAAVLERLRKLVSPPAWRDVWIAPYANAHLHATGRDARLNDYLREIGGESFTAKDFRTWAGSVCALDALLECAPCSCQTELKAVLTGVVKTVADRLGNTPTVCRKHYIHPAVLEAFGADGLAAIRARETFARLGTRRTRADGTTRPGPALNRKQQQKNKAR